MDNITHSLVGAYIGVIAANRSSLFGKDYSAIVVASVIANNLPDLDFLYSSIIPGPLGYLLHHRGHTHTILFAIVPLTIAILFRWITNIQLSKQLYSALLIVIGIGPLAHIALDALNSYGVHPFWPFSNSWLYGDTLFIIEPILWLLFSIALYFQTSSRILRISLLIIVSAAAALLLFSGYLPKALALAIISGSVGLLLCFRRLTREQVTNACGALACAIVLLFAGLSIVTKRSLRSLHTRLYSSELLHDIIISPNPSNPACWSFILVSSNSDLYTLRRGVYSLFGSAENRCSALASVGNLSPLPIIEPAGDHIKWIGMFSARLDELRSLTAQNCKMRAFLQFSRAPVYTLTSDSLIASDLRFDRSKDSVRRFAQIEISGLDKNQELCPGWLPPWLAPRADLLAISSVAE